MTAKARRRLARKVAPGGAQRHPGFVIDFGNAPRPGCEESSHPFGVQTPHNMTPRGGSLRSLTPGYLPCTPPACTCGHRLL